TNGGGAGAGGAPHPAPSYGGSPRPGEGDLLPRLSRRGLRHRSHHRRDGRHLGPAPARGEAGSTPTAVLASIGSAHARHAAVARHRGFPRDKVHGTARGVRLPSIERRSTMADTALQIPSLKDKVSPEEWAVRVDLAACYRLVVRYGWEDLVFTHITARVPGTQDQFLINPYGVFFDEITASSLVKIDQEGRKLDDSQFSVNPAGFIIHSAIHGARHDAKCVLHTHTASGVAVSTQRAG